MLFVPQPRACLQRDLAAHEKMMCLSRSKILTLVSFDQCERRVCRQHMVTFDHTQSRIPNSMLRDQPSGRRRLPRHAAPLSPSWPVLARLASSSLHAMDKLGIRPSGASPPPTPVELPSVAWLAVPPALSGSGDCGRWWALLTSRGVPHWPGKWSILRLSRPVACRNLCLVVAGVVMPDRTELGGDRATLVKPTTPPTQARCREMPGE